MKVVRYSKCGVDSMKRVIFVEPQIEDSELIYNIFQKYNPDSSFVNPHICLVFPFEIDLQTSELEVIINSIVSKYNVFHIQLSGVSVSYEGKNNFLFLNVIDELNTLVQMSSELYEHLGDNAKLRGEYTPHITIGKSKSTDEINKMFNNSKNSLQQIYKASISSVFCKKIIKDFNDDIRLEAEIELELHK